MKAFLPLLYASSYCSPSAAALGEQYVLQSPSQAPLNVAIIGAGAAGASTAYHLAKFARNGSIPVNITVFERNPYIGGRSTTVSVHNDSSLPTELGASIFVQVNSILVNAVKEFNLSTSSHFDESKIPGPALGIWNGQEIVLTANGGWFDYAKLFWRYGTAPLRTVSLMKATVKKFLQMYGEPVFPFDSLSQAAQDVGLLAVMAATGEQYMEEHGITGRFGQEVVQASTRVNYAQNLAFIHGLEAMVCMATEGAMAVKGGNWQIFERMLNASGATVRLNTRVGGIWPQTRGGQALNWSHTDGTGSGSGVFDKVILAAPYQFSELKSLGLEPTDDDYPDTIPYVELHVTLFTSPHLLSPAFFNLPQRQAAPRAILTTLSDDEPPRNGSEGVGSPGFFSVSLLRPIVNPKTQAPEYLYKVFSPSPPKATFLASLLGVGYTPKHDANEIDTRDITWIYRKVWNSYPYEYPRVTFESIRLSERVWYTGGMDSFISTMETNALMGANVAKLVVQDVLRDQVW